MNLKAQKQVSKLILDQAGKLGVSLAGVVRGADLWRSPSHQRLQRPRAVPDKQGSFIVIALEHPQNRPSIDWWDGNQGTAGNRKLIRMAKKLETWMKKNLGLTARMLPYHFRQSGVFIKDAAVLAGLGVIGRNNLVITPRFGPRVRFKALHVSSNLSPGTPIAFRPCESCTAYCLNACPQNAFVSGAFNSQQCLKQMRLDESRSTPMEIPGVIGRRRMCIQYCRACELACPVGGGS
jgi:epoxyqueuosine reductase